jgi:hypothetical protein
LEESGLEYSLIGVGLYTAVFENYPLALDFANKKALLVGSVIFVFFKVTFQFQSLEINPFHSLLLKTLEKLQWLF